MVVVITESYNADGPVTWICDESKATPALQQVIAKAIADKYKGQWGVTQDIGWQNDVDRNNARVLPPVQVDDVIELSFD
ncbi:MAG: hypothetical protein KAS32_11520 [Candidatus Peribacteraceae bacterium]|nr:hypothetical protein [Candidatus Peribacteraceae bacterium]